MRMKNTVLRGVTVTFPGRLPVRVKVSVPDEAPYRDDAAAIRAAGREKIKERWMTRANLAHYLSHPDDADIVWHDLPQNTAMAIRPSQQMHLAY